MFKNNIVGVDVPGDPKKHNKINVILQNYVKYVKIATWYNHNKK